MWRRKLGLVESGHRLFGLPLIAMYRLVPPARRYAFTLVELMAVTAVIAMLAAILFPVLRGARGAAVSAQCISNLKQLSLGFAMYGTDNDGRFPTPGGSTPLTRTGDQPRDSWLEYSQDPKTNVWRQDGGIWPYVRQRNPYNVADNLYSCPFALNFTGGQVGASNGRSSQGGQNYTMNEYLRAYYPGAKAVKTDVPQPDGFALGVAADEVLNPSQTILLFEGVQFPNGTTNRNGSPYHDKQEPELGTARPPFPIGAPAGFHSDFRLSNFSFVDGHVATLHPGATWKAATNTAVQEFNPVLYRNVCAPNYGGYGCGGGRRDLWNPDISSVRYP